MPLTLPVLDGSIGINLTNGATLPTLHFHDDESRSFTMPKSPEAPFPSTPSTSYPPPPSAAALAATGRPVTSWGGEDLLARIRTYAHLLRSTLQPTLYLVDPSKADIEAHSTHLFSDDAVDDILARSSYANSHSPVPSHRRPRPLSTPGTRNPYSQHSSILHQSMPPASASPSASQARVALLQSFANITRATRHAAHNILSHPLAKPIVPHLPDPVRSLVNASGDLEWGSWVEKGGVGEFESARVYLARWARIVAEEGERARRREAQAIPASTSATVSEETSELGVFELLHTTANLPTPKSSRDPKHPVDEETWDSWFDKDGRPTIPIEQMKAAVFRRGVTEKGTLRRKVWPYVLGVFEWDVDEMERKKKWEEKLQIYHRTKDEWFGIPAVFDRQDVIDVRFPSAYLLFLLELTTCFQERHRIDVDCRRTDRSHPLFASQPNASSSISDPEKQQHRRYSTISPAPQEIGAQSPSNEHIDRLGSILLTYNFYEKELGMYLSTLPLSICGTTFTYRVLFVPPGDILPVIVMVR